MFLSQEIVMKSQLESRKNREDDTEIKKDREDTEIKKGVS